MAYYVLEIKTGIYHTAKTDSPISALAEVVYPFFNKHDPDFAEWLIEQSVIIRTDVLTYDGFSVQY
jgi:hypothetical protein